MISESDVPVIMVTTINGQLANMPEEGLSQVSTTDSTVAESPSQSSKGKSLSSPNTSPKSSIDHVRKVKTHHGKHKHHLLGVELMPPPPPPLGSSKQHSLEKGHSHLDWMQLQKAEALSKPPSAAVIHEPDMKVIGPEELKLHNTKSDCWIALRGHVFDITNYIKFHPGGVDQIMKGAGIEATAMFNAIHRYVNFETILKGKQVGIFATNGGADLLTDLTTASLSHRLIQGNANLAKASNECWGCKVCRNCLAFKDQAQLIPLTKFTENANFVYLKVETRGLRRDKEFWTVGILNREELLLKVITRPPDMWVAHFKLTDKLEDDTVTVQFTNRFKNLILRLRKPKPLNWTGLGEPLKDHNEIEDSRAIIEDMHHGIVLINEEIAKTMWFMAIELPQSVIIGIPVGFDIKLRIGDTSRRYTPVHPIFHKRWKHKDSHHQVIFLVYRMYPDGQMTPKMNSLPISENPSLTIGCSAGNFDTTWLQGADAYFCLAAGSGITPYFRIIEFIVEHNIALGLAHVILMYWNRCEAEIVWKTDFEKLEIKHTWFHFIPILTKPNEDWEGLRGRISPELIQSVMDTIPTLTKNKHRTRFMTCGSDGFNTTVFESVETLGYHSNNLFTFLG